MLPIPFPSKSLLAFSFTFFSLQILLAQSGVIAYFPFDGTVNDVSANPNIAQNQGVTFCPDRFGQANQAVRFDLSSDRIVIPQTTFDVHSFDAITVSFWMRRTGFDFPGYNPHLAFIGEYRNYTLAIDIEYPNNVYTPQNRDLLGFFNYSNVSNFNYTFHPQPVNDNSWHHCAAVINKATSRIDLYIDGVKSAQSSFIYNQPSKLSMTIGNHPWLDWAFQGDLDEFRIHNRALSQSEIASLINGSTPTACTNNLLANPSFTTNLTSWNGTVGTWQNGNLELCQNGQLAYQTVAGEAGKTYQFHYTAKTAGTNQNVLMGLKFLSSSWNVLGTEYSSFDSQGVFGSNFISKVAPAGTAWVEVSIAKQNSGCVQVSEVCLTKDGGVQPPNPCSPDITPPVLSACPSNITQTIPGGTGAMISFTAPTATDNCSGIVQVTSNLASGSVFPVGTTTVTYTARDAANNTSTCSFTVTVQSVINPCATDITPPVFSGCPANLTITTTGNTPTIGTWTPPTVSDNCGGQLSQNASHNPGQAFPVGNTNIHYTASDASGNVASCSFVLTVANQSPGSCINNLLQNPGFEDGMSGWAGTGGTIISTPGRVKSGANALEVCTGSEVRRQTLNAQAGKTYTFTYSAWSESTGILYGLKFLSNSWQVTGSEYKSFNSYQTYGTSSITLLAPAGTTYVEVSMAKVGGGCVAIDDLCLTVDGTVPNPCASDITPPVLSACPPSQTLTTTATSAVATWTAPTATDNCPGAVTVTGSAMSGQAFAVGATTITYTARDAANNTSTCSFTITVQSSNTGSCANNLLTNASFTSNLNGWNGTGGTWQNGNLELCQAGQIAYQTVLGEAGKTYQFHYTAQTAGTNQNILFGLKFLSASWNVLGTEYSSFDSPGAFGSNSVSKIAPAGTVWVEVSAIKQNSGCAQVSEVCLTQANQALQNSPQTYTAPLPLEEVTIYPNPATQQAFIDLSALKGAQTHIRIFDAFGKLHHSVSNTASIIDLDLTGWESGMYLVRLETEGVRARVLKLVVVGL